MEKGVALTEESNEVMKDEDFAQLAAAELMVGKDPTLNVERAKHGDNPHAVASNFIQAGMITEAKQLMELDSATKQYLLPALAIDEAKKGDFEKARRTVDQIPKEKTGLNTREWTRASKIITMLEFGQVDPELEHISEYFNPAKENKKKLIDMDVETATQIENPQERFETFLAIAKQEIGEGKDPSESILKAQKLLVEGDELWKDEGMKWEEANDSEQHLLSLSSDTVFREQFLDLELAAGLATSESFSWFLKNFNSKDTFGRGKHEYSKIADLQASAGLYDEALKTADALKEFGLEYLSKEARRIIGLIMVLDGANKRRRANESLKASVGLNVE